jgi:crotonobetainyl-CoA:carnitine CoA-transferase CaiB-like acyl-CoA transferase
MIIAVGNDAQFARLCAAAGDAALGSDARFASNKARVANRAELIPLLNALTVRRTTDEWVRVLEDAGVPCGPINALDAVFRDPQVTARGMRIDLPHPEAGSVPSVANPIRLSETPVRYRSAPPQLGAHTREVLEGLLRLRPDEVEALQEKGVI